MFNVFIELSINSNKSEPTILYVKSVFFSSALFKIITFSIKYINLCYAHEIYVSDWYFE